jgi:hypothetical protein
MRREECARPGCGHSKEAHYSEIESSGDVNQERRRRYFGCLSSFCQCENYVAPKR